MSKLVGLTAAITAKLILDNKIIKKGVFGPYDKEVFEPVY